MKEQLLTSFKAVTLLTAGGMAIQGTATAQQTKSPNIIIMLADDLGWGDVGYNGNTEIKTPALDNMVESGVTFNSFYTAAPLSSPTRASVMTGRHPFRTGIYAAHTEALKNAEITIAEVCKSNGYATGFFGKWHLGWIEPEGKDNRGYYSPPHNHGFDETFATRSAVPTWNPTITPKGWKGFTGTSEEGDGTKPWTGSRYLHNGVVETENLSGDDSRVIMDRVIPFIDKSVGEDKPFMTCVWFHAPHEPAVAGPDYLEMYSHFENEEKRHYYGCITAMDDQIARLIAHLKEIGEYENTIIFFTSDNGASTGAVSRGVASVGDFRGSKHHVYEGGLRVPSIMVWPEGIEAGVEVNTQSTTCDIFPTLVDLAEMKFRHNDAYFLDGISMVPSLSDTELPRDKAFFSGWRRAYRGQYGRAVVDGDYKYVYPELSETPELYNIKLDPNETNNIIKKEKKRAAKMEAQLNEMIESFRFSDIGGDYSSY
ncbi:MAG: sulfatase-like hydrolase/transferase [Rikenellaceae bacterium]